MKYFLILFLPVVLFANLTYNSQYAEEVNVLESFNIEPSFLYDPIMNNMIKQNSTIKKNKLFFKTMEGAYYFVPAIKSILTQYHIPAAFLFLAMAESNFSNMAYSNKRASGLWQFMPHTAKLYHLKINKYVDERRDMIKSTKAAAKYLSSLHKRFGKWYLAAIAYNCGGGRLNRAIKKAKSDELSVLLNEHKKYIPKESRYYIRKIVALALIGNNEQFLLSNEYKFLLNRANAYPVATVKLPRGESLSRVAKLINLPLKDLEKLNRNLKYDFIPPYCKNYNVYIPYIKLAEFKRKYFIKSIRTIYRLHTVRRGDNLSRIGKRYGVSYKIIMDFNKLKSSRLKLRQKLIIPIRRYSRRKKSNNKIYYRVKSGDSLGSIARLYKVSIKNIKIRNDLKTSLIRVGDKLKIYE